LIRSLEKILDRAIREIQKGDTLQARMYIKLFMQTVREVYEYTIRHTNARTYVKAEGYISLYYRGRYIVETIGGDTLVSGDVQGLRKELEQGEEDYRELEEELKE